MRSNETPRVQRFARLAQDHHYGLIINKKMTAADRESVSAFIEAHDHENADQWTVSVRDHLLDSTRKNRMYIDEVLMCLR